MWGYSQSTGALDLDGTFIGTGYSGAPPLGKNNPAMQDTAEIGPCPQGLYTIRLRPECTADLSGVPLNGCVDCGGVGTHKHGPFVLRLDADPANLMFGRSGFLIHGDSITHPGTASKGCIVLALAIREQIAASPDRALMVAA